MMVDDSGVSMSMIGRKPDSVSQADSVIIGRENSASMTVRIKPAETVR